MDPDRQGIQTAPQRAFHQAGFAHRPVAGNGTCTDDTPYRTWRQVAEHRWAYLAQLNRRFARHRRRRNTAAQLYLTVAVAHLTCL